MRLEVLEGLGVADEAFRAGDPAGAMATLEPLLTGASPREAVLLHDKAAHVLAAGGDAAGALGHYERLLSHAEAANPAMTLAARDAAARLSASLGRFPDAVDHMTAWQREAGATAESFLFIARLHYQAKDYREAIPPLEQAIAMADAAGETVAEETLQMLFQMLYERRRFTDAEPVAERLNRDYPSDQHRQNLMSLKWEIARTPKRDRPRRPRGAEPPPGY